MKVRTSTHGFTLIELLISLALLGVIMTAVVYVNIDTSRSASALQSRNDLLPEMQIAQNYMASKLKEAAYVFPVGANIQMASTAGTTSKPGGGLNWVVGTDPIVAFILPPRTVTAGACATATVTTAPTFCYAFYAFYAMNRNDYINAVTGADDPGANPANDTTASVLMEYRGYYSQSAINFASSFSPASSLTGFSNLGTAIPTGNRGRMLMDYLSLSATTPLLFAVANAPTAIAAQQAGVTTVTMNLAAQQIVAGQTVRLPSKTVTDFTSLTIYPRNVGKTILNN